MRYRNVEMRQGSVRDYPEKEQFFLKCHGTASSLVRLIRRTRKIHPALPIVVLVGSESGGKFGGAEDSDSDEDMVDEDRQRDPDNGRKGHIVPLVLIPGPNGYRAVVKESNPIQNSRLKRLVCEVVSSLSIREVQLVGLLKKEVYHWHTDCIREGYKVVGNVLDGSFFWEGDLTGCVKVFNVHGTSSTLISQY